ncbi:hypothetical protein, partial [Pseudomonas sp. N8]|uniref:hypothetical protein n=1 Tax=Pseudomonas sp. N8 TaxID=3449428 RepID=UPI003F69D96E
RVAFLVQVGEVHLWRGFLARLGCAAALKKVELNQRCAPRLFFSGLLRSPRGINPLATNGPHQPELKKPPDTGFPNACQPAIPLVKTPKK